MATVLSQWPANRKGKNAGGSKYSIVLDGQIWSVVPQDFGIDNLPALKAALYNAARYAGKRMSVQMMPDGTAVCRAMPRPTDKL